MSIISDLLGSVLSTILNAVGNYGLAIILFTILVKVLLLPLSIKQTKSTKAMQDIQPKIQELQEKYKNKPEKQQQEIMKLYQEAKINPLAGCLPLFIQLPILLALFNVLREPVTYGVFANQAAYDSANLSFLWISSLSEIDIPIAILSGISAYLMQTLTIPKDQLEGPMKYMSYMMLGMSFWMGLTLPSGLILYWTASNVFAIGQHFLVMNPLKAKMANSEEVIKDEKKPRNKK